MYLARAYLARVYLARAYVARACLARACLARGCLVRAGLARAHAMRCVECIVCSSSYSFRDFLPPKKSWRELKLILVEKRKKTLKRIVRLDQVYLKYFLFCHLGQCWPKCRGKKKEAKLDKDAQYCAS